MSHAHRCQSCGVRIPCDGYRVGCPEDGDQHCVAEDDGPMLCRACGEEQETAGYDAHDADCERAERDYDEAAEG